MPIFQFLPFGSGSFTRYNYRGWHYDGRSKAFEELGEVYAMVGPGGIGLHVCNEETITDIFHRRNDFKRPLEQLGNFEVHQGATNRVD